LAGGTATPALASTTDAAFSQTSGALNVDYASYLAKHDIVYNRPNTNPAYGLPVGNGRTGGMAWSQNGLTMQTSGVDLSEQSAYAAGLVNLTTSPAMDTGYSTYQQRLSLYDGTLVTRYDANRTVTVMGSPNSEVMGIHVDDSRSGVSSVSFNLSMWDPATVTNIADVPDLNTWKTISTFAVPRRPWGRTVMIPISSAWADTQPVRRRRVRDTQSTPLRDSSALHAASR